MLEKTLESPLDCKEINQSILKEMSPEYSLEGLMLKPKIHYFGPLMATCGYLPPTIQSQDIVYCISHKQPQFLRYVGQTAKETLFILLLGL